MVTKGPAPWLPREPMDSQALSIPVPRQTLTSIYRSRLATVAAINGACPAGGCALAMCCAAWRWLVSVRFIVVGGLEDDFYRDL